MADRNVPQIDRQKCTVCGLCVDECPENVLAMDVQHAKAYVRSRP